jgi:hypothetical protein
MALVSRSTLELKRVYRHTFDLKKQGQGTIAMHTLVVNPEDFTQTEPARVNVTETLGGAYVTDFGKGLPVVTITGTTGYRQRTTAEGKLMDGFEAFIDFRNKIYRGLIESSDPSLALYWYNWEDNEFYEIQPTEFRLQRNREQPLLYRYELKFTCINRLNSAKSEKPDYLDTTDTMVSLGRSIGLAISNVSEILTTLTGRSE